MSLPRSSLLALTVGLFLTLTSALKGAEVIKPGEKLNSLTVGPVTYVQVQVRSYNARTLMITHAGGMASVRLRDLDAEWQARFGYDPAAEAAADAAEKARPATVPVKHPVRPAVVPAPNAMERLLLQFGTPAAVQPEVNLRPKFMELELPVKSQGRRPSCSVFAIVSALEYQNALLTSQVEKFSEEYLFWATRRSIQRIPAVASAAEADQDDADAGFSLNEVVAALRAYGIPPETSLHYQYDSKTNPLTEPPPEILAEARSHRKVSIINLPGRDAATRLNNLVLALNAGMPVPIGLAWPHYRTLRSANLSNQTPMIGSGHAVTLVGYLSATGKIEDAVFIFKNSWGSSWGQGGYGRVTYEYLSKHLYEAVLLDVQRG